MAKNEAEAAAMEAVKRGAGEPLSKLVLKDPRLQIGNWEKVQYVVKDAAGKVEANIHYVREILTEIAKDFKFK